MDLLDSFYPQQGGDESRMEWCGRMCLDGQMVPVDQPIGTIMSSMVVNGLVFGETMLLRGNTPYDWRGHYMNIVDAMSALGMKGVEFPTSHELLRRIEVLSQKNHYPGYSIVRVTVWQETDTMVIRYAITQKRLEAMPYGLKGERIFLSIYEGVAQNVSPLSWIEMPNPTMVMASREARQEERDGACIVNGEGRVVTTTLGNIYVVSGAEIIGVRYTDGARRDPIEATMETVAEGMGYVLKYVPGIHRSMLMSGRECFICTTSEGVRPVDGCGDKRYAKNDVAVLAEKMREEFVF